MDTPGHESAPAAGPALVGVALLAAVAAVLRASRPILDGPDPFWHWDLGRRILSSGLPSTDPYSFLTTGETWILNQWGTDALFGLAERVGGLWLLAAFAALLVGTGILLTGLEMWRRSPSLLTVALLGLVLLAAMRNWALRGNLLSFILIPLLLRELRRERPRLIVVAPLMLAWANVHAGFLLGLALIVINGTGRVLAAAAEDRQLLARRHAVVTGTALAATLVTPYGPRLLFSTIQLAGRGPATGISEWTPTSVTEPNILPFTLLVGVVLVSLGVAGGRREMQDHLIAVAAVILGVSAVRNVAPTAIVLGVVGAPHVRSAVRQLADRRRRRQRGHVRILDVGLAVTLVIGGMVIVALIVPPVSDVRAHSDNTPVGLFQEIGAEGRARRLFTTAFWGPAAAALTPDNIKTAVDGRLELFADEELLRARTVESADPGWQQTLDMWCVTDVLVPDETPLGEALPSSAEWTESSTRTADGTGVIIRRYVRRGDVCAPED